MLKRIGFIALAALLMSQLLLNFSTVFAKEEQSPPPLLPTSLASLAGPFHQLLDTNGDGSPDFSFLFPSQDAEINDVHTIHRSFTHMEEKEWIYNVAVNKEIVGELRFLIKQIEERELAYFIRYIPIKETEKPLIIQLHQYGEEIIAGKTPLSELGESKLPYAWERFEITEQPRDLPVGSLYLEGEKIAYRVSGVDSFQEKGYSVRDQLTADQLPSTVRKTGQGNLFTFHFPGKEKSFSETWGILGDSDLYNWNHAGFANFMLRDDISINKKLSMEGIYFCLPSSYQPYSKNGFYLNPANIQVLRGLSNLDKSGKGRFLNDLALMVGHMSVDNQNKEGFWPTQPKSEWLESEYKIGYNYYDNRRNADNATFILELYKRYPDPRFKEALEKHVDFLYDMIESRSVRTSELGMLYTDYTGFPEGELSHVALNHHIAVVNFLLKWELLTQDETAIYYSRRMLIGIRDTANLWVKEDKNLYYALYANLTPHPYPDYVTLTLSDLQETQYLLGKLGKAADPSIQYLIDHKSEWVANQNS